jgi:ubiquinone/menaquinone biosynthesis C-methylase UbiE
MIIPIAMYGLGAYVADVITRPELVAKRARRAANRRGKPLLNVGAGTPGSSVRVLVMGQTNWGDINCDLAGTGRPGPRPRRDHVYQADVQRLPFRNKQFGAVIASHVLEHVPRPDVALCELERVADEVFVICPPWWAPHTWLHPGHQWYLSRHGRWLPLYRATGASRRGRPQPRMSALPARSTGRQRTRG